MVYKIKQKGHEIVYTIKLKLNGCGSESESESTCLWKCLACKRQRLAKMRWYSAFTTEVKTHRERNTEKERERETVGA
jgi:hypothetical protein